MMWNEKLMRNKNKVKKFKKPRELLNQESCDGTKLIPIVLRSRESREFETNIFLKIVHSQWMRNIKLDHEYTWNN